MLVKTGGFMELFNVDKGSKSVEEQVYGTIKDKVNFSFEEFMAMPLKDRTEWVDAWRLAALLSEQRGEQLYEGYSHTDVYSDDGQLDLGSATIMVCNKKRALDMVEKHMDIELTPAQFILMGDIKTHELINATLKTINQDTARTLEAGRMSEAERVDAEKNNLIAGRAIRHSEEISKMFGDSFGYSTGDGANTSGNSSSIMR